MSTVRVQLSSPASRATLLRCNSGLANSAGLSCSLFACCLTLPPDAQAGAVGRRVLMMHFRWSREAMSIISSNVCCSGRP